MDGYEPCDHSEMDGNYCLNCGECIYYSHLETVEYEDKVSLLYYTEFLREITSLPERVKEMIINALATQPSLPASSRAAMSLIYSLAISFKKDLDRNDRENDDGFMITRFNSEMSGKLSKIKNEHKKFGRKNINHLIKRSSDASNVNIRSPIRCVKIVCEENEHPELIEPLRKIIHKILNSELDPDKSILSLSPEIVVVSLISLYNDKYEIFKISQNLFAKNNGLAPTALKDNKMALKRILENCRIEL